MCLGLPVRILEEIEIKELVRNDVATDSYMLLKLDYCLYVAN